MIIQHRDGPFPDDLPVGVFALHDTSRGTGQVPASRPDQIHLTPFIGYAGGFTPDNVVTELAKINAKNYWIDMESGVRDEQNHFDLNRCEAVCKAVYGEP